jgi:Tol biopolymer transport system component
VSIELDWQIVAEDAPPPDQPSSPSIKPHRTRPRVIWIALAIAALAVVSVAVYSAWVYRAGLAQASDQVRLVARLEAQAVAQGDRESFMALQDPDDSAWRSVQSKRFGQLERAGLTEFGWKAAGASPQFGAVSLEPDGARLDVTYRFSVTQPLPGGPVTVSVQVPQYYKRTPSGWVRAMPGPEFWGGWRKLNGKHIVVIYFQRDAALIEPFVPRLDEVMDRVCESLTCPVLLPITFDRFPETLLSLSDFSYGYDNNGLKLPSPHWIGLPADSASREELYRAYGTRLAQALVYKASNSRLTMSYLTSKEFVRWELAQAGLSGPFISEAVTRTLRTAPAIARQPLSAISVRSRWLGLDASPGEVVVPLAFDFLERQFGAGTVPRLLPALATPRIGTLGEAISMTLRVSSATLEPAWQKYVRQLNEALSADSPAPGGELALWCARNALRNSFSIWRIRADGTGLAQISSGEDPVWPPHWSPDGKQLAYAQGDGALARVRVLDADTYMSRTVAIERGAAPSISWLADNRLLATAQNRIRLMNIVTGEDLEISGPNYIWSPDGMRTVSMRMAQYPTMTLGLADANGRNEQPIAPGERPTWSPDSTRVAFFSNWRPARIDMRGGRTVAGADAIQILDAASGVVTTLAREGDLLQLLMGDKDEWGWMNDMAWSPDGQQLAVAISWSGGSAIVVLAADTGQVRAQWQWPWTRAWFPAWTWSPDSRRLAVWVSPDSMPQGEAGILDVQTGTHVELPGKAFGWSPDGKWLAVAQDPSGLLLLTPDQSSTRWLDTPDCFDVLWRPGGH